MSATKLFRDAVHPSLAAAFAALEDMRTTARDTVGIDPVDLIRDNLPTITTNDPDTGEQVEAIAYGLDDAERLAYAPEITREIGHVAIVSVYESETAPGSDGTGVYALPAAIYVLNLPKSAELWTDARLEDWRERTAQAALLSAARRMAKAAHAGTGAVVKDRISALLAAQSRSGASAGRAFDAVFPILQATILNKVAQTVDALKAAGQTAKARVVAATFPRARFGKETLRECLSSATAAKQHFPQMPQSTWEQLLRAAIAYAPNHQINRLVKDPADPTGKANLKELGEDGKERAVRELAPAPQSPVLFQQWLETRDEATLAAETVSLDLSDLTALSA